MPYEVQTTEHEPGDQALTPASQTPMAILRHAILNNASVEVIDRLMGLQERYEKGIARKEFDQAIAAFKVKLPVIEKNKHVGFEAKDKSKPRTDYWHEDLGQIARTIDPILGENGLSYRFRVQSEVDKPVVVTCIVSHRLGHFEETTLTGPKDATGNKNALQSIGSTITYLQRYTLKAALGLSAAKDDDGQASEDQPETVSEEQAMALRETVQLICEKSKTEVKPTIINLGKAMGLEIESLSDIPAASFEEAKRLLAERLRGMK